MSTVITSAVRSAGIAAIFGALGFGCAAASAAAAGAENADAPRAVVQYTDLNLSDPQDARELYNRIAAAAEKACTTYPVDGRSLAVHAVVHTCIRNTVAAAVTKIGRPELFAIYNAKNHRHLPDSFAAVQSR